MLRSIVHIFSWMMLWRLVLRRRCNLRLFDLCRIDPLDQDAHVVGPLLGFAISRTFNDD